MTLPESDEEAKRDQRKRDLFFTDGSEQGRDDKPAVAPRIQRPQGQKKQRGRQWPTMKIPQGFAQDFRRREVGPHESGSQQRQLRQTTQSQQQKGNPTQCQGQGLQQQQRLRAAVEQIQRRDQEQDGLDMHAQARWRAKPIYTLVGETQGMAMQGIPDGLIEVAQVESVSMVGLVADEGMLADERDIYGDERERDQPRQRPLNTRRAQDAPRLL